MKLADIIFKSDWEVLDRYFKKYYPNDNTDCYKEFLEDLKKLTPVESDMMILVDHIIEDHPFCDDIDDWFSVHGIQKESETDFQTYALEYSSFEEWLGMEISEETLKRYPKPFIIIHCLWEMTFCGFSNETIKNRLDELNSMAKGAVEGDSSDYVDVLDYMDKVASEIETESKEEKEV